MTGNVVLVPVSIGELVDKISILEIKAERIKNPTQLENIERELIALRGAAEALDLSALEAPTAALKTVNEELWDIEDYIRDRESNSDFGAVFIALARSIYRLNDERARLKRVINEISGSRYVEEKLYRGGESVLIHSYRPQVGQ